MSASRKSTGQPGSFQRKGEPLHPFDATAQRSQRKGSPRSKKSKYDAKSQSRQKQSADSRRDRGQPQPRSFHSSNQLKQVRPSATRKVEEPEGMSTTTIVFVVVLVVGIAAYLWKLKRRLAGLSLSLAANAGTSTNAAKPAPTGLFEKIKSGLSWLTSGTNKTATSYGPKGNATSQSSGGQATPVKPSPSTPNNSPNNPNNAGAVPSSIDGLPNQASWTGFDNFLSNRKRYTTYASSDSENSENESSASDSEKLDSFSDEDDAPEIDTNSDKVVEATSSVNVDSNNTVLSVSSEGLGANEDPENREPIVNDPNNPNKTVIVSSTSGETTAASTSAVTEHNSSSGASRKQVRRSSAQKSVSFGQRTLAEMDENGNIRTTVEQIEEVSPLDGSAKSVRVTRTSKVRNTKNPNRGQQTSSTFTSTSSIVQQNVQGVPGGAARYQQHTTQHGQTSSTGQQPSESSDAKSQRPSSIVDTMRINIPIFGPYVMGIGLGKQVFTPEYGVSRALPGPPRQSNVKIEVLDDDE